MQLELRASPPTHAKTRACLPPMRPRCGSGRHLSRTGARCVPSTDPFFEHVFQSHLPTERSTPPPCRRSSPNLPSGTPASRNLNKLGEHGTRAAAVQRSSGEWERAHSAGPCSTVVRRSCQQPGGAKRAGRRAVRDAAKPPISQGAEEAGREKRKEEEEDGAFRVDAPYMARCRITWRLLAAPARAALQLLRV